MALELLPSCLFEGAVAFVPHEEPIPVLHAVKLAADPVLHGCNRKAVVRARPRDPGGPKSPVPG